mgnify:CR=1 FL=1
MLGAMGAGGGFRLQAAPIPVRRRKRGMGQVRTWWIVHIQRPLRHVMPGFVAAGEQADAGWCAHRGGVGLSEFHAFAGQPFHCRRFETLVQRRAVIGERNAGILPTHVIGEDEQNVGRLRRGRGERDRDRGKQTEGGSGQNSGYYGWGQCGLSRT